MNRIKLKNFAVRARRDFLAAAEQRAGQLNINGDTEAAACLWFSRFAALRYMEANGYIGRVFADDADCKQRIITQCRALSTCLGGLFEPVPWAEELFPEGVLAHSGFVSQLINGIPKEYWLNNVQIVGWLYQYYNSVPRAGIFDNLKKAVKIAERDIPAATQLFTPGWIVRFMTDNTLGRLIGGGEWTVGEGCEFNGGALPTVLDPCMGSGHILVHAFDRLVQLLVSRGYTAAEAAAEVMNGCVFGLDIDKRAYDLAYFALKMKGRQYDEHFLERNIEPNIAHFEGIDISGYNGAEQAFAQQFENAGVFGSLMDIHMPAGVRIRGAALERMAALHDILNRRYDAVITNPPYMNSSSMSPVLSDFIRKNYPDCRADLFAAFIVRCTELAKPSGYLGFLTPYVWMFIQSYEKLREFIFSKKTPETLIQFEYSAFEEATVPVCTFTLKNSHTDRRGAYIRLTDFRGGMEIQGGKALEAIKNHSCGYYYEADARAFEKIPGRPAAYWLSEAFMRTFEHGRRLGDIAEPKQGLATGCNDIFLRYWFEVAADRVFYGAKSTAEAAASQKKWFPYNKGGEFRKWYGNDDYVVNWENDGQQIKNFRNEKGALRSRPQNRQFYFRPSFSWSLVSSGQAAFRYKPHGYIFDIAGMSCFADSGLYYLLGLCNSVYAAEVLKVIAPTINYQCGDIAGIPVIVDERKKHRVEELVKENISISKADWDSFEISRDFARHPLV